MLQRISSHENVCQVFPRAMCILKAILSLFVCFYDRVCAATVVDSSVKTSKTTVYLAVSRHVEFDRIVSYRIISYRIAVSCIMLCCIILNCILPYGIVSVSYIES